jgi:catechol-2,3-dioxygenase
MVVKVVKLGFLGLNTVKSDVEAQHFNETVGLPVAEDTKTGDIYFACGNDHHALSLHRADRSGFRHVGLQIAGHGPLDDALKSLQSDGIKGAIKSDVFPGLKSSIEIADPDGYPIYLYREMTPSTKPYQPVGVGPQKLGHLAMYVADAKKSEKYYTDVLGFRWSDWIQNFFVFMRCNVDHHAMNFLTARKTGMFHVAWELDDVTRLIHACDLLARRKARILWGPGRHGPGHNIYVYHYDPEGNVIEFFGELDRMSQEELGYFDPRPYHRDNPQRPKVWTLGPDIDIWGTPPPPEFKID